MPVKKLDASGLASGVVALLLDILNGQAAPIEQSKGQVTTLPCQRRDQMHPTFSLTSSHIS